MNTVRLATKCGEVIGREDERGRIFEGLPYATAERFELPKPVTDFGGTFDATKKPLEFPQDNTYIDDSQRFFTKEFRDGESFEYAESPLTLNIITPKEPQNCPVLIYIHGGGFHTGKQSEHPAGTSFEYAGRGIILVSISYRLNVFALYRCGNYYLYDQLCAINWIKDNIADYGGDAGNMTLIGQSAGAMSVFQLLYTDALDGIIKRAILMSGAGFFPRIAAGYTKEQAKPFWDEVMHEAGCENDEQMKKAPAEKLWRAWWEVKSRHKDPHLLMPGVDGKMIPVQPREIKKSGKMLDIPMIIGVTSQDMLFPLMIFNMAKRFAAWSYRRKRSKVYLYYFDRTIPEHGYKAFHSADLWYVFGNMEKSKKGFAPEDYELKDRMAGSVESFIKKDDPEWLPFSLPNGKFRRFDTGGAEYVRGRECFFELFRNSFFERGPF